MKAHEWRLSRGSRPAQKAGPEWVWGEGALEEAAAGLLKLPQPLLLVGESALLMPLRKRLSQAWIEAGVELSIVDFPADGECCEQELERLLKLVKEKKAAALAGFGGGKCIDTVKWAGLRAGLPVVSIPSSPATCACATAVVVVHDSQGAVLDLVDLESPPKLCVVDFEILRTSPSRLLAAGAADTLAKWLEWSALEAEPVGAEAAKEAFEILKAGPEPDIRGAWRACLRLSAEASNAGNAPAAAAHSFCAGISLLPKSLAWLHGEWAALGLLFQDRLLGLDNSAFLKAWGFATKLPFKLEDDERQAVARRILRPEESIHAIDFSSPLSLAMVEEGLRALEP